MRLFKDIRGISIVGLFAGILIMGLFITNAGDDFFYGAFVGHGHFMKSHIDHYLYSNGRCIVHILASVFLGMPHIIWKIVNAGMWAAIAINIYKLVNIYITDTSKLKFIMFMLCGGFLTIHIEMAKESSLWLTGSFNYTYPIMMFTWYWYLLLTYQVQSIRKLCIVGFLSAASMEQESALTVMLTVGLMAYMILIAGEKPDKKLRTIFIVTVIGAVSLFLAPGNIRRMGDEIGASSGTFENILSGIDFMLTYCISSDYMVWLNAVFMTCCAWYVYRNDTHILLYLLVPEMIFLYMTNHSGDFEQLGAFYSIIFAVSRIYYFFALFAAAYVYFRKNKIPIILILLGFGIFSCAFIVFSPTLGPRVILLFEVTVIISTVLLMAELLKKQTKLYALVHLTVLVLSVCNVVYISQGFYKNHVVYKENEKLIEQWKVLGGNEVNQKQYRNDAFEHSMPYNSEYHEGRYKEFFGIPLDTSISWK